jgi:protein-tyrosine kinase
MLLELETQKPMVRAKRSVIQPSKLSTHYEALLQRIQAGCSDVLDGQAIGITGCATHAGASTVAFNIAVTAEQTDCGPVLFIDADVNKRSVANMVGVLPPFGLGDVLAGTAEPLECVKQTRIGNLSIVPGHGRNSKAVSRIEPGKFSDVLNEYRRHFKLLVVDIPAPTELNASACLAGQLDGVVVVIEAERVDGRAAVRTKQKLVDANANLIGVVLNKRRQHIPGWLYRLL